MKPADRVERVPPSGIRKFFELAEEMDDIISLGVGEPDFAAPWAAREAAIASLEQGKTSYTANRGKRELRDLIAADVDRRYDLDYDADEEILVTAGASEGIDLAFRALVDPGDTVAVAQPSYVSYVPGVTFAHGEVLDVPTRREDEFKLTRDVLEASGAQAADVLVMCYPNNPTGDGYPRADLVAYAQQCRGADTALVVDEAFLDFTDRRTLAGEAGVIVARSLTKIFGLPGLRTGLAVATGGLRDRLEAARPVWGLSTPAADVGAYCLRRTKFVAETRDRVRRERRRMVDRLDAAYEVYPSEAPFLLLGVHDRPVEAVIDDAAILRAGRVLRAHRLADSGREWQAVLPDDAYAVTPHGDALVVKVGEYGDMSFCPECGTDLSG